MADDVAARPLLAELLGTLGEDAFVKPLLFVDYGENLPALDNEASRQETVTEAVRRITSG